jgi:hypothetical protein
MKCHEIHPPVTISKLLKTTTHITLYNKVLLVVSEDTVIVNILQYGITALHVVLLSMNQCDTLPQAKELLYNKVLLVLPEATVTIVIRSHAVYLLI